MGAPPTMPPRQRAQDVIGHGGDGSRDAEEDVGAVLGDCLYEECGRNGAQLGALEQRHQEFQREAEGVRPGKTSRNPGAGRVAQRGVVAVDDAQEADLAQGNRPSVAGGAAGEENDRRGRAARLREAATTDEVAVGGEHAGDAGEPHSFLEHRRGQTRAERNEGQSELHAGDERGCELRTVGERHGQGLARTEARVAEPGDQSVGQPAWIARGAALGSDDLQAWDSVQP